MRNAPCTQGTLADLLLPAWAAAFILLLRHLSLSVAILCGLRACHNIAIALRTTVGIIHLLLTGATDTGHLIVIAAIAIADHTCHISMPIPHILFQAC